MNDVADRNAYHYVMQEDGRGISVSLMNSWSIDRQGEDQFPIVSCGLNSSS